MKKGIIFDMDGVLVLGANKFHIQAWEKAFKEYNIAVRMISLQEYSRIEGMTGDEIEDLILQENNLFIDNELKKSIYARKKDIFKAIDNPYTPDETKKLLHYLHEKEYRMALASGNNRTVIENFLTKQNLQSLFDAVISGDEVEKGKPNPEVFLKAQEKLQLPKDKVVIVENAPIGVAAGKAADIYTIALTSTVSREELLEADKVIDDLQEVTTILENS